jgi:hypothetical protein
MLIGLNGYAGAGKDTAAAYLVENHGFTRLAFADKLKDLAYAIDPDLDFGGGPYSLREAVDEHGWDQVKRVGDDAREFLQSVGMACRAVFGEDFWIRSVATTLATADPTENFVITDVRFPNEVAAIRARSDANGPGCIVRVERDGCGPVNGHESEEPLVPDLTVTNADGDRSKLFTQLDWVVATRQSAGARTVLFVGAGASTGVPGTIHGGAGGALGIALR